MKLTMSTVSTLKLPAGTSERIEFDDDLPGFGLRLRNDTARWIYQYKTGNQHRRITIGNAKALSVTQARKTATDQLSPSSYYGDYFEAAHHLFGGDEKVNELMRHYRGGAVPTSSA